MRGSFGAVVCERDAVGRGVDEIDVHGGMYCTVRDCVTGNVVSIYGRDAVNLLYVRDCDLRSCTLELLWSLGVSAEGSLCMRQRHSRYERSL